MELEGKVHQTLFNGNRRRVALTTPCNEELPYWAIELTYTSQELISSYGNRGYVTHNYNYIPCLDTKQEKKN